MRLLYKFSQVEVNSNLSSCGAIQEARHRNLWEEPPSGVDEDAADWWQDGPL